MSAISQEVDRKLAVAVGILGLRAVGSFGFPLLVALSWPGQAYAAALKRTR